MLTSCMARLSACARCASCRTSSRARTVKRVRVIPEVPAHRVSICYQISEFGPGFEVLVDLTRELVAQHKLFV